MIKIKTLHNFTYISIESCRNEPGDKREESITNGLNKQPEESRLPTTAVVFLTITGSLSLITLIVNFAGCVFCGCWSPLYSCKLTSDEEEEDKNDANKTSTNENSRIGGGENVKTVSRVCTDINDQDITYKLMFNNFDQAVLRETLSSQNITNQSSQKSSSEIMQVHKIQNKYSFNVLLHTKII